MGLYFHSENCVKYWNLEYIFRCNDGLHIRKENTCFMVAFVEMGKAVRIKYSENRMDILT